MGPESSANGAVSGGGIGAESQNPGPRQAVLRPKPPHATIRFTNSSGSGPRAAAGLTDGKEGPFGGAARRFPEGDRRRSSSPLFLDTGPQTPKPTNPTTDPRQTKRPAQLAPKIPRRHRGAKRPADVVPGALRGQALAALSRPTAGPHAATRGTARAGGRTLRRRRCRSATRAIRRNGGPINRLLRPRRPALPSPHRVASAPAKAHDGGIVTPAPPVRWAPMTRKCGSATTPGGGRPRPSSGERRGPRPPRRPTRRPLRE